MVSFLNTWAQKIIVVVIICTIIEMILPESKNKKYIKTVAGIYVVFTIIGPIIAKINTKESINLQKYINISKSNTIETSVNLDNNKYIEDVYREKLSADVKEKIEAFGYDVRNLEFQIETENEKTYGSIKEIELKLGKKQEEKTKKIQIEPIVIGKEKPTESYEINEEEKEKIKTYLSGVYLIDKEKINISRLNCSLSFSLNPLLPGYYYF